MQTIQVKVFNRIPLVGGMTDYPSYYREHSTRSICCAISKYLQITIEENGDGGVKIESKSDLPWGIGLGSSGAFYSALILALAKSKDRKLSKLTVARLAYDLETGIEDHATGRQDSVACLFRGVSNITYLPDNSVKVEPISIPNLWQKKLSDRLLLFDTGVRRRARDSIKNILSRDNKGSLSEIAKLPGMLVQAWRSRDLDYVGTALNLQEQYRSELSPTCKSPRTDELLAIARKFGTGARLTGAGLGSLLCYCPEEKQPRLREKLGIPEITFSILW